MYNKKQRVISTLYFCIALMPNLILFAGGDDKEFDEEPALVRPQDSKKELYDIFKEEFNELPGTNHVQPQVLSFLSEELNKRDLPACPTLLYWTSRNDGSEKIKKVQEEAVLDQLQIEYQDWCKGENSREYTLLERCLIEGSSEHLRAAIQNGKDDPFAFIVGAYKPTTFMRWVYLLSVAADEQDQCKVGHIKYAKCRVCFDLLQNWLAERYGDIFKKDFALEDFDPEKHVSKIPDEYHKRTPLMIAVLLGRYQLVSLLLKHGAEALVNTADAAGNTALKYAHALAHQPIINLLVLYGAQIDPNNEESKPARVAVERSDWFMSNSLKIFYEYVNAFISSVENKLI